MHHHRRLEHWSWLSLSTLGAFVSLSLLMGPNLAHAGPVTWYGSGTSSDGALSATADFTFGSGTLTVTLTNTLAANVIRSAGQALSDISFTLSNAPGTLGTTSASGQFGDVDGSGKVTYVSSDTVTTGKTSFTYTTPTRWLGDGGNGGFAISGNTITLETIGGGQPSQMIIPNLANNGNYNNVNNGFQNFNAYVIGPATFTLALSGVTPDTTVTAATFSFGTGPDTFVPGSLTPPPPGPPVGTTPAPPSIVLMGLGGLGMAFQRLRWRRRFAAAA